MISILFTSAEAAFIVGVVPAALARDEPILFERGESLRIGLTVFYNHVVLSLLHVLSRAHAAGTAAAGEPAPSTSAAARRSGEGACGDANDVRPGPGGGDSFVWLAGEPPKATAFVMWTSIHPEMRLRLGGNIFVLPDAGGELAREMARMRDPLHASSEDGCYSGGGSGGEEEHPPPRLAWLLPYYHRHADRAHLAIVVVQGAVVGMMLLVFLYTNHWRSHAVQVRE